MLIGKRETVTLYVHQSKTQERLLLGFLIVWQLKRTPILDVLTMRITGHYPCTVPLEPKFYVRCLIPVFACFSSFLIPHNLLFANNYPELFTLAVPIMEKPV